MSVNLWFVGHLAIDWGTWGWVPYFKLCLTLQCGELIGTNSFLSRYVCIIIHFYDALYDFSACKEILRHRQYIANVMISQIHI
jgi:hypothetical protein